MERPRCSTSPTYSVIECGTDLGEGLNDEEFQQLMQKQYDEMMDGVY